MTVVDERPALCEGCGGHGQIATGVQCPVCKGIGVATAAGLAAWRQAVVDQALASVRRQLVGGGTAAVTDWLREGAQARQEAQQAARRATQAAEQAQAHAQAPHTEAQAVLAQARAVLARAEALAAAPAALPPGIPAAFIPPDPTDPPPGAPIPPGFGAGDIFYFDSILARQVDVWGALNSLGGSAGFANPMTTAGDLITGGAAGTAQRLGLGTAGQALLVNPAGTAPAWSSLPFLIVPPSADTTGATDLANLNAAFTALPNGGIVWLLIGTYYIGAAGLNVPPYIMLRGGGHNTIINYVGAGTAACIQVSNTANPPTYIRLSGNLLDFVIDGTSAGAGAIGLSLLDTNGVEINVGVRNFTGAGSIGVRLANNTHSLNQLWGYCRIENCTNGLVFTSLSPPTAMEHIYVSWSIDGNAGQNPISVLSQTTIQGSIITAAVGSDPGGGPVLTFGASCSFADCTFQFKAEQVPVSTTSTTVSFNGSASGFTRCGGSLFFSSNITTSNIVAQSGKMQFYGSIQGETTLQANATPPTGLGTYDLATITTPAFPGASGTAVTNNTGIPVHVTVAGGTLSGSFGQVNGVTVGDVNTRVFMVPRGQTITLNWSAAPTGWTWQPMG